MNSAAERLRGVAVGAGYFSQFHLDAWRRMETVDLCALCDLDREKAEQRCQEYGIAKAYTDYREMLDAEQPDFVDIITRPDTHASLCAEAAARGLAVICQKPLAPTLAEARLMVARAHAAGTPFMVHENFRFQPWHREMRKLIDAGAIGPQLQTLAVCCRMGDGWQGDAYQGRQPYFRTMPRLLVYETVVHFIDTLRFLGGEIHRVYARLRRLNPDIRGEDTGLVALEFRSGAEGIITATRYHESAASDPRYTFGEFLVDGSRGTLALDLEGNLTVKQLGHPPRKHEYAHRNYAFASDCVLATQQHFVQQLLGDQQFETSGDHYLRTLEVQEAVYASAESGLPVCVSALRNGIAKR